MMVKVNPHEAAVQARAGTEVTKVNPIGAAVGTKAEPRFKPKGGGSLIPPKRKLVKKMLFDCMVKAIIYCFNTTVKHTFKDNKKIFRV